MLFFSGFGCKDENELFSFWLDSSRFSIAGFSMGAIDAVEFASSTTKRVDKLLLFSPAYFCNTDNDVKTKELDVFENEQELWFKMFYTKAKIDKKYQSRQNATAQSLRKLLYYEWKKETIQKLIDKKIEIDIFFGTKDKIIDTGAAINFFKPIARQITLLKNHSHTLIS